MKSVETETAEYPARPAGLAAAVASSLVGLAIVRLWLVGGMDRSVYEQTLNLRVPWLTPFMTFVTRLGSPVGMVVLAALAGLWLWHRFGRWALAGLPAAVVALSTTAELVLKAIVGRVRPPVAQMLVPAQGAAFPSGHATVSAGLLVFLALLAPVLVTRRWVCVAQTMAVVATVSIGLSRLYLGVHWSADVLAGWSIGAGIAAAVAVVAGRLNSTAEADSKVSTEC